MKVVLPRTATAEEIIEAMYQASKELDLTYSQDTRFAFLPGSVTKEAEAYIPKVSGRIGRIFSRYDVYTEIEAKKSYNEVGILCIYRNFDIFFVIAETTDYAYDRIERSFTNFLEKFFAELQ